MQSTSTLTVFLPPKALRETERATRKENRTKSELMREALCL